MVKNYELIEIESTVQIGVIDIRLGVIIICPHKALKLVLMDVTDVEVKPRSLGTRHLFVFLGENSLLYLKSLSFNSMRIPWVCQCLCHEGESLCGNRVHGFRL